MIFHHIWLLWLQYDSLSLSLSVSTAQKKKQKNRKVSPGSLRQKEAHCVCLFFFCFFLRLCGDRLGRFREREKRITSSVGFAFPQCVSLCLQHLLKVRYGSNCFNPLNAPLWKVLQHFNQFPRHSITKKNKTNNRKKKKKER